MLLQLNINDSSTDGSFTGVFRDIFFFFLRIFSYSIMKMYVMYTHYNRLIEAILMRIFNIPLFHRRLKGHPKLSPFVS